MIDKYTRRDKSYEASNALTPSQFWKMYESSHTIKKKKKEDHNMDEVVEDDSDDENNEQRFSGNEKFHFVMKASKGK